MDITLWLENAEGTGLFPKAPPKRGRFLEGK
jgi:hypothetical protein